MRASIKKDSRPLISDPSQLRSQHSPLESQHYSGVPRRVIYPCLAHAPQRGRDCMGDDKGRLIIDKVYLLAFGEVHLACAML